MLDLNPAPDRIFGSFTNLEGTVNGGYFDHRRHHYLLAQAAVHQHNVTDDKSADTVRIFFIECHNGDWATVSLIDAGEGADNPDCLVVAEKGVRMLEHPWLKPEPKETEALKVFEDKGNILPFRNAESTAAAATA